jgi:hypothetical protein
MIKFRMLTPHVGSAWEDYAARLPARAKSVHFTQAYARVQEAAGGEAYCAVAEDGDAFIMQPFMLRTDEQGRNVVESLYGYGGPVGREGHPDLLLALGGVMADFHVGRGVICERVVLSPHLAADQLAFYRAMGIKPRHVKDVVVLPTKLEDLDAGMTDKRRAAIFKAKRDGIATWRAVSRGQSLTRFVELYRGTMARVGAAPRWRFPRKYFEAHLVELPGTWIVEAYKEDVIVSSAMVLTCGREAHYQFAGNSGVSGASDLVILEAARLARDCGCKTLDLGGGVTAEPDDPVFWYKSTFSQMRRPVYVVERVHDQAAFDEASKGCPQTGFFPPWRAGAQVMQDAGGQP